MSSLSPMPPEISERCPECGARSRPVDPAEYLCPHCGHAHGPATCGLHIQAFPLALHDRLHHVKLLGGVTMREFIIRAVDRELGRVKL